MIKQTSLTGSEDADQPFDRYSTQQFEDCPQLPMRDSLPGLKIPESELTQHDRIQIKVTNVEVKKGSWPFTSDYAVYTVECTLQKKRVRVVRKDFDFYTLRKQIRTVAPHVLVPPLPL